MRIYSAKTYIIWPGENNPDSRIHPICLGGEALRRMVKSAALMEGDVIYEATEFARVREKRSVELIDTAGAPVEDAEGGEEMQL